MIAFRIFFTLSDRGSIISKKGLVHFRTLISDHDQQMGRGAEARDHIHY